MDAASRVIMASRMLERISDNAVEIGERLVFLLTGKRRSLDDLRDLDDDDLQEMYAARGVGLVADRHRRTARPPDSRAASRGRRRER